MNKKNLIFDKCQRGKFRRAKIYHWRRVPECKVQPVTAKIEGRQVTDYSLVPNREHDNQGCTTIRRKPFRRYDNWSHTTFGQCDVSLSTTFGRKNSQVRHLVEIVKSLFFDQTSYSTKRRIYQMSLIIKKRKS